MAQPLDQFVKQLVLSTLLGEDEVRAFLAGMSRQPPDGDTLARELVRQKKLTAFQAQQIYAGKAKSLVLGNYLLLDKLGQGGMGMVLKAVHRRMERMVALKVLSPAVVKTPEALRRFQREVKAAARLTHPNIVIAHDADEAGGTHFLVMEFVDGADLSSLVKKGGPLPLEKALACIIQAARGLEYAHTQGIVHRDIKPANLLLDSKGTIKILDMGLARLDTAGARQDDLTGTGQIMGTVDYMAPEQAANTKNADHRADIYSLGVTLWYLVSGKAMYDGETVIEKLLAHQSKPIPSLAGQAASLPGSDHLGELDSVFQKMVAKAPADRFQSMTEVIAALEKCRTGGGTTPTVSLGPSDDSKLSNFLKGQGSAGTRGAKGTATAAKPATSPAFEETLNTSPPSVDTDPTTNQHLGQSLVSAPAAKKSATQPARDNRKLILYGSIGAGVMSLLGIPLVLYLALSGGDPQPPKLNPVTAPATQAGTTVANHCLNFDGKDYVELPDLPVLPGSDFTVEALVRILPEKAVKGSGALNHTIAIQKGKNAYFSLLLDVQQAGSLGWRGGFENQAGTLDNLNVKASLKGVFDHVAFVVHNQKTTIFVNGTRASVQEEQPPAAAKTIPKEWIALGANYSVSGVLQSFLKGDLDEIRFSKSARYEQDFTPPRVGERLANDADTLALYHCDAGSGDVLKDDSGHGHDGKIVGAKWLPVQPSASPVVAASDGWQTLFAKDLEGWRGTAGLWKVSGGMLIGDSAPNGVQGDNTFLVSPQPYRNFEMNFDIRITGPASANSGLQIRSEVVNANEFVMRGPQIDFGTKFWGALYGEKMSGMIRPAAVASVATVKENAFNRIHVRVVGKHVKITLNGVTSVDDDVAELPDDGLLGWQLHRGEAFKIEVKDVLLRELDAAGKVLAPVSVNSVSPPSPTSPLARDLLDKIDLVTGAISGEWQRDGQDIVSPVLPYAQLALPIKPRDNSANKLTLEVTREAGTGPLVLGLRIANTRFLATIDNTSVAAVSATPPHEVTIGDLPVPAQIKYFPGLALGKPAQIEILYNPKGVSITIDGQPVLSHQGDMSTATMPARWQTIDPKVSFIGASLSRFRITKLESGAP